MWHHLMLIRGWFTDYQPIVTMPGSSSHEVGWHWFWSKVFLVLSISDVFVWARVIHCVQFFWALFCIGFFTYTVATIFFPGLTKTVRQLIGLYGAWVFILGAGTLSVRYQMSWLLWYSVNYQGATLPSYFLAMAFVLDVLVGVNRPTVFGGPIAKMALVVALVALIVSWHPLEASYFIVALALLVAFFPDRVVSFGRTSPVGSILLIIGIVSIPILLIVLPVVGVRIPQSRGLALLATPDAFFGEVSNIGHRIQELGMHRGPSSFSEAPILGCILLGFGVCFSAFQYFVKHQLWGTDSNRIRLMLWAFFASVGFGFAPQIGIISGFLGVMTVDEQVWRFAFGSPWFLGFSIWAAYWIQGRLTFYRCGVAAAPLLFVFLFSRFVTHGPFNGNASSLFRSLEVRSRDSVGIQYDRSALKRLEATVLGIPAPLNGKQNVFLVRADLQTYLRAATGVYVLGYRLEPVSKRLFNGLSDRFELVEIPPPPDLPVDEEMRKSFPMMGL